MHIRNLKPSRFDLYILGEVIGPFLGGLVFIIFILLMFQALRLAESFIVHGVAASLLGKMTALMALSFVPTALPVAFLVSVLVAFGRLSSDSELIAMKASGVSTLRMTVSISIFAAAVVGISLLLNLNWVPWGEREFKTTLIRVTNTKIVSSIKEGTFTTGFYDLLIFAEKVDPKTHRLSNVFIYDDRDAKNPTTVISREGEIVPVRTESDLAAAAMLELYDGSIHNSSLDNDSYQKTGFSKYDLYLKVDEGADTATIKPHMIPQSMLVQKIQDSDLSTYEGREWRGEYWRRYAVAFTPFIFGFLGIGYGTVRTRSVKAGATLTAVVILIIYWTAQTFATMLYQQGRVAPFWAMEIPNMIVGVISIYGFRRASW